MEALTYEKANELLAQYGWKKIGQHVDLWTKLGTEILIVDELVMITTSRKSGPIGETQSLMPYNVDVFEKHVANA